MTLELGGAAESPALGTPARDCLFPLLNNLFWVHHDIVEVCAKWMPRHQRDDERMWMGEQLAREAREIRMYRSLVGQLGREPDVRYRIQDSLTRYRWLKDTEDYAEVLVGMNILAQAVLGWIEHNSLFTFDQTFFAEFADTIAFDAGNWQRAQIAIERQDQASIERELRRYYIHLQQITVPELEPLLMPVIDLGILPRNAFVLGEQRYCEIAAAIGVDI
jgi:hypothetical protein